MPSECGDAQAVACYRWSSRGDAAMFVPAVPATEVRAALTHEYGHHIDATRPHVTGARGLDGTPSWWRARGMADRLARGEVAWDYSRGWDHAVAEIYAEDYAVTNGAGTSGIRWLGDPPSAVQDAIRADLAGPVVAPAPPAPAPPTAPAPQPAAGTSAAPKPLLARRSGRLAAGARARDRVRGPAARAPGGARERRHGGPVACRAALQRPRARRRDRASEAARGGPRPRRAGALPRHRARARRDEPVPGGRPRGVTRGRGT